MEISGRPRIEKKNREAAKQEIRSCITWLRGGNNGGRGQQPFNRAMMADDLEWSFEVLLGNLDFERPDPGSAKENDLLELNRKQVETLLFHFHKNGIPETQTAAKMLERLLANFLGVETKDEYVAPCLGALEEGRTEGEQMTKNRLRDLRRENECVGGDQTIVNAVRKIEEKGVV